MWGFMIFLYLLNILNKINILWEREESAADVFSGTHPHSGPVGAQHNGQRAITRFLGGSYGNWATRGPFVWPVRVASVVDSSRSFLEGSNSGKKRTLDLYRSNRSNPFPLFYIKKYFNKYKIFYDNKS